MPTPSLTPPRPSAPAWAVERWLRPPGRLASRLGRALDAVAQGPAPFSWIVQLLSSIWLGLLWLGLIGLYVALGSGFASLRAWLEMTDLQFFDAPPMVALMILLCVTLTVVTLRRIPLNIFKLGVWMVHVGIITLIASCFLYFSHKQEGSVRIFLHQTVDHYFDATQRALYVQTSGTPEAAMLSLPDLPIYYEHLASTGNPLNMNLTVPGIPDLHLRITGYYPAAILAATWAAGPADAPPGNPALAYHLEAGGQSLPPRWLIGQSPAGRVEDAPPMRFGIEYLYHPTPQRRAEITASFDGQAGLTVRVPKLGIDRTYAAQPNVPIKIDGAPYVLTPEDVAPMPMLSKGYENAFSSALMVGVDRQDAPDKIFSFKRMAVFRYPERSPDFLQQDGKLVRKQDGVDGGIQIIFHDAARDQFWIVEDEAGQLTLVQRAAGGQATTRPIALGVPVEMTIAGGNAFQMVIDTRTPRAVPVSAPMIIPPPQRQRSATAMEAMANSVIELEATRGAWRAPRIYVPYVQFCATEPPYGVPPTRLDVPGLGPVDLILSNTRRALPSTITLDEFNAVKDPFTLRTYANYISTLRVQDKAGGPTNVLAAQLNAPASDHGLYYFQSAWDGHDEAPAAERFSVIGVGNRPGIDGMIAGALLIFVGIGYAFYIKPILLNVKKQQLAAAAQKG